MLPLLNPIKRGQLLSVMTAAKEWKCRERQRRLDGTKKVEEFTGPVMLSMIGITGECILIVMTTIEE